MFYNLTGTTKSELYINGPQGPAIRVGAGTPNNLLGNDSDLFISSNNNLYIKRAGTWVNITDNDIIDISLLSHSNGNIIQSNGTVWQSTSLALNSLSDVAISAASTGHILYYNGTDFVNGSPGATTGVQPYDADLTIIAGLVPTDNNFIVGNGTSWTAESGNTARTSLGLGTGDSPTFVTVNGSTSVVTPTVSRGSAGNATLFTDAGANNITIGGTSSTVIISGNLTINGVTTLVNSTNLDVTDKNITINKGGTTTSATVSGINIEGDSGAVVGYLRSASDNSNLEFKAPTGSILTLDMNSNSTIQLNSPTTGQVLKYDGAKFINTTANLDDLGDTIVSSPTTGQLLKYNGTNWTNSNDPLATVSLEQITGFDSQLSEPMLFVIDSTRSNKKLSVESSTVEFTAAQLADNDWLRIGQALDATTGHIMSYPGTLIRANFQCANTNNQNKNIVLYINGVSQGTLFSTSSTGDQKKVVSNINIDFSAGDKIQLRAGTTGNTIQDTVIDLVVKWRKV